MIVLIIFTALNLKCSTPDEKQNLDINVSGVVTNQSYVGIANVTIYVQK